MRVAGLGQDITYWAPQLANQFGVRTHASPILLQGRWQSVVQEVQTISGETFISHAYVYADQDLGMGGFLAPGDKTGVAEPTACPEAYEIKDYHEDPDLRACSKLRRAIL